MEDPTVEAPDVVVVDSPSSSTDDLKDEKVIKKTGIDDDEEEFDLVSHSTHSLVPGTRLKD